MRDRARSQEICERLQREVADERAARIASAREAQVRREEALSELAVVTGRDPAAVDLRRSIDED